MNNALGQLDLIDIYRTFHPKAAENTFFSSAHGMFSRIDYMLGHKTSLNKFKRIEIISSIFSNHNGIKLEINYRKKNGKNTNMWRMNIMLLKKGVNEEIKEEVRRYLARNENKNTTFQNLEDTAKAVLRRNFIVLHTYLRKPEKSEVNNLTYHLKELEKEE